MRSSIQPTLSEVEDTAKTALQRVSLESTQFLLEKCRTGGLNGKRYDACFYGLLARGSGCQFPAVDACDDDHFKVLERFCISIGVVLVQNKMNPIEAFCLALNESDTTENSDEISAIATWCLEALASRVLPDYTIHHDHIGGYVEEPAFA